MLVVVGEEPDTVTVTAEEVLPTYAGLAFGVP